MTSEEKLIEITKTSKRGTSLRMTLPKPVAELLSIGEKEFLGFYSEKGEIIVRKIQ